MSSVAMYPVAIPTYDPSQPQGGDPMLVNVNDQWQGLEINYIWNMIMGMLVFLIIPGVGLLYGGMSRRKSSLAMLFQSLMVMGVVSLQWVFWGYSLAFSRTGSAFIGNMDNFALRNVMAGPAGVLPEITFCFYQMMFACTTVQIVVGGSFDRGRILPSIIFSFIWVTIVYCPIACWTWNSNGWLYKLPSYDFAGGGPVHQASGWAALAYALVLGKRTPTPGQPKAHHKPHNTTLVFLGTVLIWFGWFGFNGGSELAINVRALLATFNTNTAAAAGVLGWTLVDFIRTRGKFSVVGACSGAIAGLVGVTPAAGFVSIWIAALIGFLTAFIIAWLQDLNEWLHIDEGMEVFKLHGIGGILGSFWTGIFAQQWVSMLDGAVDAPGGLDGNGVQVGHQLAEICAIAAYSFTMSCIILLILKYIPGLHLRVTSEQELLGYDLDQFFDEQIGDYSLYDEMLRYKEQAATNVQHLQGQRSGSPDGGEGSGDNIEMGSINEMTKSDR